LEKVIFLKGGLGNQMFQWAFLRYIEREYEVTATLSRDYIDKDVLRTLDLELFELDSEVTISLLRGPRKLLFFITRVISKLTNINALTCVSGNFLSRRAIFFDGYWQNPRFYSEVFEKICCDFTLKSEPSPGFNAKCSAQLLKRNSIAIHIRRGDYYSSPANEKYRVIRHNYFLDAVEFLKTKLSVNKVNIAVFTDDKEWVKKEFDGKLDYIIMDEGSATADLIMMSSFRNIIISNSSFSWWAAALSPQGKNVVMPEFWVEGVPSQAMALENWFILK